jgi:hypothetical protein
MLLAVDLYEDFVDDERVDDERVAVALVFSLQSFDVYSAEFDAPEVN